ncbi:carboxymuconolactone decarboxylase family protein [Paracoccus aerodenitrificans]|uniref:carboxymuconolactone decarboxylase family protein n=1 Tax=Paracoccus aerodenitrificans TaxID=3017781 RepID=UPI0022EFECBB|nr:carboxymuconolactone decarboxylase family protein [Paracoccus aerodenitrificans]WBU64910.1 carboxymuconolactone decarboxylase family protein [Paracoccus aerodenitrificans]
MNRDFRPVPDENWPDSLRDLKDGFATALNVYRVMAHHPDLLRAWAPLREHVVKNPVLDPAQSEIVILRCAHRLGAEYEWSHHVHRARRIGMDDSRIVTMTGDRAQMKPQDALLAQAVDELFDDRRLSPGTLSRLRQQIGREGVLDLMATVGFYTVLGFIVQSFGTPLDDDIAREMTEWPLLP